VTLLDRLKTETRPAHDRIEAAMDLARHLETAGAYRSLLARLHGFHAPWEEAAGRALADEAFFGDRRKAGLLARDLAALGLSEAQIRALPRCRDLPPMRSAAEAYGSLYVVEGSTLGGAIIARQVEAALGLSAETGCAYFRAYGSALGPRWKAFQARLLAMSSPAHDDLIVASASRTFAAMQDWLCAEAVA
jgi:heme oxygenase